MIESTESSRTPDLLEAYRRSVDNRVAFKSSGFEAIVDSKLQKNSSRIAQSLHQQRTMFHRGRRQAGIEVFNPSQIEPQAAMFYEYRAGRHCRYLIHCSDDEQVINEESSLPSTKLAIHAIIVQCEHPLAPTMASALSTSERANLQLVKPWNGSTRPALGK